MNKKGKFAVFLSLLALLIPQPAGARKRKKCASRITVIKERKL